MKQDGLLTKLQVEVLRERLESGEATLEGITLEQATEMLDIAEAYSRNLASAHYESEAEESIPFDMPVAKNLEAYQALSAELDSPEFNAGLNTLYQGEVQELAAALEAGGASPEEALTAASAQLNKSAGLEAKSPSADAQEATAAPTGQQMTADEYRAQRKALSNLPDDHPEVRALQQQRLGTIAGGDQAAPEAQAAPNVSMNGAGTYVRTASGDTGAPAAGSAPQGGIRRMAKPGDV